MKQEIRDSVDRTLEQAYHTSDILLEQNFSYFFDLYYDVQMRKYMNARSMDTNDYTEVIDYLLDCVNRDIMTDSVYLYNESLGMIFSSKEGAFPIEQFGDQEMIACIENNRGRNRLFPRELHWKIGTVEEKGNVISYLFYDESLTAGNRMALVVNIDQEKYQNLIGKNLEKSYVLTEVLDSEGRLVSGNRGKLGEVRTEGYIDKIIRSGREKDAFDFSAGNQNYYISWQNSSVFGWVYVGIADYNELLSAFNRNNRWIIFSSVFFIIIGLLFSIRFTRKIYVPVRKLLHNAKLNGFAEDEYGDEYEVLNAALQKLFANVNKPEMKQSLYSQNKRKEIIEQLLYGSDWPVITIKELQEIGLEPEKKAYCVVRFSFHHYESLRKIYTQNDMSLFQFAAVNILEEYLGNQGYVVCGTEDGERAICLILQQEKEYELDKSYLPDEIPFQNVAGIQKILEDAREELEKVFHPITFCVCVGRSVRQYKELYRSWLDTKYASEYIFIRGTRLVILFTEHMESYESQIPYPLEMEKKLFASVKSGAENQILSAIEDFFQSIQKMSPREMKWALNQMVFSLFHMGMLHNYTARDKSPLDWKSWADRMNAADTKEEVKSVIIQILTSMTRQQENINEEKGGLAQKVKNYINEHFREETLSVTEAASYVGFSTNYVRTQFKNEFGESISDYIQRRRIEEAKTLLRTTDFTGKKIAGMVGYSDNRYFYVVFKKITGVTVENYRQREGILSGNQQQEEN